MALLTETTNEFSNNIEDLISPNDQYQLAPPPNRVDFVIGSTDEGGGGGSANYYWG